MSEQRKKKDFKQVFQDCYFTFKCLAPDFYAESLEEAIKCVDEAISLAPHCGPESLTGHLENIGQDLKRANLNLWIEEGSRE